MDDMLRQETSGYGSEMSRISRSGGSANNRFSVEVKSNYQHCSCLVELRFALNQQITQCVAKRVTVVT